jgi:hypothetical protein
MGRHAQTSRLQLKIQPVGLIKSDTVSLIGIRLIKKPALTSNSMASETEIDFISQEIGKQDDFF